MSEFMNGPDGPNQGAADGRSDLQPPAMPAPQYEKISEFSLKVNPYTIWVNIICVVLFVGALIGAIFLFPAQNGELIQQIIFWALTACGGLVICLLAMILSCLLKLAFLKKAGGGKSKLFFGLVIDVYAELPVKRNRYILADTVGAFITLCVLAVLTIVFWNALTFLAFSFLFVSALGNIPIYAFELKQPESAFLWLDRGILYSLKKI